MKFALFSDIAILGTGFMGASLGLAIKKIHPESKITGYDINEANLKKALEMGAVDSLAADLKSACDGKSFVILASYVATILNMLPQVAEHVPKGCLVTDLGSTKNLIVSRAAECFPSGKFFVGSHPMRGSTSSGPKQANGDILNGACCYVVIGEKTDMAAAADIVLFWKSLGARPVIVRPDRHDELTAFSSHLPHLASVAMSLTGEELLDEDMNYINAIVGKGFKWSTQTAKSPTDMWIGVAKTNRFNIINGLRSLKKNIGELSRALENEDYAEFEKQLMKARNFRINIDDEK